MPIAIKKTVTTTSRITLTKKDIIDLLKGHIGTEGVLVQILGDDYGNADDTEREGCVHISWQEKSEKTIG